jgi:hypothetical protein
VPIRVGAFDVHEIERHPDGMISLVTNIDWGVSGIVFSPNGPPAMVGEDRYWHLDGPWWKWSRGW